MVALRSCSATLAITAWTPHVPRFLLFGRAIHFFVAAERHGKCTPSVKIFDSVTPSEVHRKNVQGGTKIIKFNAPSLGS